MYSNLERWFGQKTFIRARSYAKGKRVLSYHYDGKYRVLSGKVQGNERAPYSAEIDFSFSSFSDPVGAIGDCTCPVGSSCKHICALLLTVLEREGEQTLRRWMEGDDVAISSKAPPPPIEHSSPDLQQVVLPRDKNQVNLWLTSVASAAELTEQEHKTRQQKVLSQRRYLLYLLDYDHDGDVVLTITTSQQLKRGGHGAPRAIRDLSRISWDTSPPFSEEDQPLIQKLFGAGILNPFSPYGCGGDSPEINNKVPDTLFDLAQTGRLAWHHHSRTPILAGKPVAVRLEWVNDDRNRQCSRLTLEDGAPVFVVPTLPLTVLYVDRSDDTIHENHHDREARGKEHLLLARVVHDMPDALLRQLIKAPAIPAPLVEKVRTALAPLPGMGKQTLPETLTIREVTPVPVVVLDGVPAADGQPVDVAARARLFFQYGPLRVSRLEHLDPLINDDGVRYPRNRPLEINRKQRLELSVETASVWAHEAAYEPGDYCVGSLRSLNTDSRWLQVVQSDLPTLEHNGWKIEIEPSFPYGLVDVDESDWFGEVASGESGESDAQEDWFGLKLGIEVEGEKLDLLPLIAKQLDRLPDADKLKKMKNEPVSVAIGPRRFITVPAKRLRLIIVTLLELFGDRGAGVQRSQAPILEELSRGLGLDFAGGEFLKEITRKLKNFRKLKAVKPPKHFHGELRDYQMNGLAWLQFLREMGLGGILADDMGLGKTVQALAHIQLEKERLSMGRGKNKQIKNKQTMSPCLVIAPTSLMHNWRREAECFAPELNVVVYHGSQRQKYHGQIPGADLVLTTYALIQRDFEQLKDQNWHILLLDESQAIKNHRAKAAQFVRLIKAEQRLCMTGTPVENNLAELWSQFDFLMPGFLGQKDRFSRFYRTPIERRGDNDRRKQLTRRVAPFMLRRTKDLVAKELPPKTEILRECELKGKQRDLYETVRSAMEKKVREEISKKGLARSQIIILDALLKMRQTCCDPQLVKLTQARKVEESAKMDLLCSLLDELLAEGRKILIFSQFTTMLALIEQELNKRKVPFVLLTGQTKDRDTPVQQFQKGQVPVFLISLKAGGAGLNLTAADTVIHYDPWWNPAVEDQATDRAYRIGQDKPVFVYKLVAMGTLEEKMLHLKERKKALAEGVYSGGGKKAAALTAKDLDVLFEPLADR